MMNAFRDRLKFTTMIFVLLCGVGGDGFVNGDVDEIRIYAAALPANQVTVVKNQ